MSGSKAPLSSLAGLSCLAIAVFVVTESTKSSTYTRAYAEKHEAVRIMQRAQAAIFAAKRQRDVAVDFHNDPERTGLIGPQYSLITTDRGTQSAKNLAAHPSFAAAVVDMMVEAGAERGDLVAVGLTGSLPGLNVAVLAACSALGVEPVVVTSVGSSMFGATDPEMTWLDMEAVLARETVLPFRSVAASLGGGADVGRGLSPAGRQLLRNAIEASGIPIIEPPTVFDAVNDRVALYDREASARGREIRLYLNVGGGVASLGGEQNARLLPAGLSRRLVDRTFPNRGVINVLAERAMPVIHLHDVERLARRYRILDVHGEPTRPAEGPLFITVRYNVWVAAASALLLLATSLLVLRHDIRRQVLGQGHPERAVNDPATGGAAGISAVLLALLLASPAAAGSWHSIEEVPGHQPVRVLVDGSPRNYFRASPQSGLELGMRGPARLRIVVRPEIDWTDGRPAVVTVTVRTETRLLEEQEWQSPASSDARLASGSAVGESRQMIVNVPKGERRILLSVTGGPVLVRLLTAPPGLGRDRLVTLTPVAAARSVSLAEGERYVPYFSILPARPVRYRLVGPTTLELLTRLDFDPTMRGAQAYTLRITDNGRALPAATFTTTKALTATWAELPTLLPGKFRRLTLDLDEGTHDVELALGSPTGGSVEVHARIPEPAIGETE